MDYLPEDREWSDEGAITFDVPEHAAWEIQRLAEALFHADLIMDADRRGAAARPAGLLGVTRMRDARAAFPLHDRPQ
jgi:hypothetical protein